MTQPLDPISVEQLAACPFCGAEVEIADVPTASEPIVHHPPYDRYCALADKFIPASAWNTRAHQPRSGEMREAGNGLAGAPIPDKRAAIIKIIKRYNQYSTNRENDDKHFDACSAPSLADAILALISSTVTVPQDAEGERLRKALTPSADTKAAYIGEIKDRIILRDEDGEEYSHDHTISWDATKAIMKIIADRAALTPEKGGE